MKRNIVIIFFMILLNLVSIAQETSFEWASQFKSSSGYSEGRSIKTDAQGNVYTVGIFIGTVDFDPGIGLFNLSSTPAEDIFITKQDSDGNLIWAKQIGGPYDDFVYNSCITIDVFGNIYITGGFKGVADLDPGEGIVNYTSKGNNDGFVLKLDVTGNFVWAKQFSGVYGCTGYSIAVDHLGNLFTVGIFLGTIDFDPGEETYNLIPVGNTSNTFISKLDASGNFIWAKQLNALPYTVGESTAESFSLWI